uniref:Uncharacterized protein n=1 Tax=Chromera velia CCMP2878 TaxID=1169474 RepID=A0A0K6S935_9ALVE|eukprot:Cvel_7042.t1-p1 / transcript=Cvel_7042.t1 / gene=Cvel_7042 / organism=Chromera_velia_CCMP2878 / gene_product=hypothetical protein / transcript_product=hypothetical protein / location=Cvel_scaffold359:71475-73100(-) / protein_length=111 / sequence_SO=supercontig / SO=protein_coding / is_pseudo=false
MACGVSELVSSLSCRLCVQGRIDGRAWTIFCKGHLLRLLLAPFLLSLSSEVFTNVRRLTSSKPRLRVARKELREVHLQGLVKLLLQIRNYWRHSATWTDFLSAGIFSFGAS